jgi:CobQ-like glutamine amidotransferase family enzyme
MAALFLSFKQCLHHATAAQTHKKCIPTLEKKIRFGTVTFFLSLSLYEDKEGRTMLADKLLKPLGAVAVSVTQ